MLEKYKVYYRTLFAIFWVFMCFGFVSEELLPFLKSLKSPIFALADFSFLFLGIICLRRKSDLYIILSFVLVSVISTIIVNRLSLTTYINGSRDFFGLLFALPVVFFFLTGPHAKDFKKRFDKQLFIWLCLQPFCMVWQFMKYGAGDHGGGSIGNMESGICSIFIYTISFYLVYQKWDYNNYGRSLRDNWIYIFLLFPTFLNETKASFIYLALYFVLLYKPNKSTILKIVYIVPIAIVAFIGLGQLYAKATHQEDTTFDEDFFITYFIGFEGDIEWLQDMYYKLEDGEFDFLWDNELWNIDVPRFAKIMLMFDLVKDCKGGMVCGAGIGQLKGQTNLGVTDFFKKNAWIIGGSKPWLFYLFIQLGFLGYLWFFPSIYYQYFSGPKMRFPGYQILIFILACSILMLFYGDSFRKINFCLIFFYLLSSSRYIVFPLNRRETTPDKIDENDIVSELDS